MAWQDIVPFHEGQGVTAGDWNTIFEAIQNGNFFLGTTGISEEIHSLTERVTDCEERLDYLESLNARQNKREQFVLTADQAEVSLEDAPVLDSEQVFLNGVAWAKTGIPVGFTGDYSVDGSRIIIDPLQSVDIEDGDTLVVTYQFEVV